MRHRGDVIFSRKTYGNDSCIIFRLMKLHIHERGFWRFDVVRSREPPYDDMGF